MGRSYSNDMEHAGTVDTKVGKACFLVGPKGLTRMWFESWDRGSTLDQLLADGKCELKQTEETERVATQLREYFEGSRQDFDLDLDPKGTDFQRRVWAELLKVPYGQTCSYADIARALGQPTATRAVGAANGANPIGLVVPCHRVIGADKSLTGYAGGLDLKRKLLEHEGAIAPALFA